MHFIRYNHRNYNRKKEVDKAIYIESRRSSRLALQCQMDISKVMERQIAVTDELQAMATKLEKLQEDIEAYSSVLVSTDEEMSEEEKIESIVARQELILKQVESLREDRYSRDFSSVSIRSNDGDK